MKHLHLRKSERVLLIILAVSFLMLMSMFDLLLANQRRNEVQNRIDTLAEYQISGVMNKYVTYSQAWDSVLLNNNGEMDLRHFNQIAQSLMDNYNDPAIRCIQLAPNGVIQFAYPLKGFESAIDGDLFSGHRREECEYARDTGKPTMNGPYELTQGGVSCIIRNPLYLTKSSGEKEFWGFSIFVLYFPEMLADVNLEAETRMYDYEITHISEKTEQEEVIISSSDKILRSPVTATIPVPNGSWTMYAEYRNGWISVGEILFEVFLLTLAIAATYVVILTESRKRSNDAAVVKLINDSDEAMCVVARDGGEVYMCNKAFRTLWGNREQFVPGLSYKEFFERPVAPLKDLVENPEIAVKSNSRDSEIVVTTEEITWNAQQAYLLRGKEYDAEYFDHLTLLPNEFYFNKKAQEKITDLQVTDHQPACVFYDIVHMKLYNAQNGFEEGDRLLKDVAFILQEAFPNALVSRFANDHFCLITESEDLENRMMDVDQKVRKKGGAFQAEIKAGAYLIDRDYELSVSQITDAAKMAADSIHDNVEHNYRFYDEELRKNLQARKFIIDHLEEAIENGEIKVFYQPIVRTINGKLCGYEALARWISPELGFLSPRYFHSGIGAGTQDPSAGFLCNPQGLRRSSCIYRRRPCAAAHFL